MLCIVRKSVARGYFRERTLRGRRVSLDTRYKRSQLRLLRVFGAIFGANIFTWLPSIVSIAIVARVVVPWFIVFGHLSLLSQAVIHPILQVTLLKKIRDEILNFCKCQPCVQEHSSSLLSSSSEDAKPCCRGVDFLVLCAVTRQCSCCCVVDKCAASIESDISQHVHNRTIVLPRPPFVPNSYSSLWILYLFIYFYLSIPCCST